MTGSYPLMVSLSNHERLCVEKLCSSFDRLRMSGIQRRATALLLLFLSVGGAAADHPFDPKRYAFELFSEDEIALSTYSARLPEQEMLALLQRSWDELDSAAAGANGLPPDKAKEAIRQAVRGEDGVARRFEQRVREAAGGSAEARQPSRLARAARHPLIWAILALFVLAMVLLNRRRT